MPLVNYISPKSYMATQDDLKFHIETNHNVKRLEIYKQPPLAQFLFIVYMQGISLNYNYPCINTRSIFKICKY